MKKVVFVSIYIILTLAGLVLMKFGGNTGSLGFSEGTFSFSINYISFIGFVSYILSFLIFTNIVVKFDLSYITPITAGIIQVLTLISGILIFNETISIKEIIGVVLVILGVIIMNIKVIKKATD